MRDWLSSIIDELELKAEFGPLSEADRLFKKGADEALSSLKRIEEAKWAQRAKVRHVQQCGNNTKYFHLIANGKHRKKNFFSTRTR